MIFTKLTTNKRHGYLLPIRYLRFACARLANTSIFMNKVNNKSDYLVTCKYESGSKYHYYFSTCHVTTYPAYCNHIGYNF